MTDLEGSALELEGRDAKGPCVVGGRLVIVSHTHVRRCDGRDYITGGFGRHVDAFARRFDEVVLLTCAEEVDERPEEFYLKASNVRIVAIRPFPSTRSRFRRYLGMTRSSLEAAWKLPRLIREADAVHPRLPSLVGMTGALMMRYRRKPTFFYMAGDWEVGLLARGDGWLVKSAARFLHKSLAFLISGRLAFVASETLAAKFGWPNDDVLPMSPTALDRSNLLEAGEVVQRVGRPPRQVLFVGAVWRMKGVHVLLEAARELLDRGLELRVRLIGQADDAEWFRQEVESRGLDDVVTHTPHMAWNELLNEYDEGDVFVMPSLEGRGETGPKVVLEAMARGVPVVASRVGFVSQVVRDRENGWIVRPGSSSDIVEAVSELWQNRELRERFAKEGVATAANHDLDGFIDRMTGALLVRYPHLGRS